MGCNPRALGFGGGGTGFCWLLGVHYWGGVSLLIVVPRRCLGWFGEVLVTL